MFPPVILGAGGVSAHGFARGRSGGIRAGSPGDVVRGVSRFVGRLSGAAVGGGSRDGGDERVG